MREKLCVRMCVYVRGLGGERDGAVLVLLPAVAQALRGLRLPPHAAQQGHLCVWVVGLVFVVVAVRGWDGQSIDV